MLFGPFLSEFGWRVLTHVRHVHRSSEAKKIVCCEKGLEVLYPSATEFFTDFQNPVPDTARCGKGGNWTEHRALADKIKKQFPEDHIDPLNYDCHWHTSDLIKPKLICPKSLPKINITCGVRKRDFGSNANWEHWPTTIKILRSLGLKVGLVGSKDGSFDLDSDVQAWAHPLGATYGSVDLLLNCDLYVGSDTGVSHLAAMLDTPMVAFYCPAPGRPDLTGIMQRANKRFYYRCPNEAWNRPDEILGAILRCLRSF